MRKTILFLLSVVFLTLCAGCNTLKGAADGFSKDWQEAKKVDDWLQRNAW